MADAARALSFDPKIFGLQIILFLILWAVMNAIFWKPFLAQLRGRDQEIQQAYNSVENTRHEMERLKADYQSRLVKIEAEARTRIQEAIKEAQAEREQLVAQARSDAEAALKSGIADMERDKAESIVSLRSNMTALAYQAVSKALGPSKDPETLHSLLDQGVRARSAPPNSAG